MPEDQAGARHPIRQEARDRHLRRLRARASEGQAMKAITRTYYRVLDFAQRTWHRFRKTEVGAAVIWLAPRTLKAMWWLLKVELAFIILMYGALFFMFLVVTGNGKTAINAMTKITLVVI